MSVDGQSPRRGSTPSISIPILPPASALPQKRALEDDHQPAVSSPLNPDFKSQKTGDETPGVRERASRAKKESLKKRESKAGSLAPDSSARATPDPKASSSSKKKSAANAVTPLRYKIPPPKIADFDAPRGPTLVPSHTKVAPDGTEIQFHETTDHVYNKKSFRYTRAIADPKFPSILYYRQTETAPFDARLSFEDSAPHMMMDETAKHITTDKGFRMAKANVGIREGRWYWECKITSGVPKQKPGEPAQDSHGHVRMGFARREAAQDAPVGFDAYSYGIRDVAGQKVWMSRPKDFFPAGESINEGDVIGLEINLPSEKLHQKVVSGNYNPAVDLTDEDDGGYERPDIIRDRVPIRFKNHLYFEQIEYSTCKELEELMNPSPVISSTGGVSTASQDPSPTHPVPALRTLPHSSIKIYKNGKLVGTPFTNLLSFLPPASKPVIQVGAREGLDDGMLGYFPAVSVFRGGAAEVNFGPDWWCPPTAEEDTEMGNTNGAPQAKIRAASERYDEQIVEDIMYDLIDEVDFWMIDGGDEGVGAKKDLQATNRAGGNAGGLGAAGGVEIKELVQDEE
ncbi:Set1 complex component ash2 protein [Rutstroemia sp. NJR-2017a WRK4]|nr:Set1 complex component ash2 protein [Rutstroemia sp. NJR-2017a WRK4]